MKKKYFYSILFFGLLINQMTAQFDTPSNNTVSFESIENDAVSPEGLEIPTIKKPSFSNSENKFNQKTSPTLGEPVVEEFDMNNKDGFLDSKAGKAPKYFTQDKEVKEEYGRDQFLGDFKTTAVFVNVVCRDHQYVDGDRIRIFVNDDIVQSDISLDSSFRGFDLVLVQGFNRIEFLALNQGSSGPNTAELHVYDDNGVLVSAHEWNLLTGNKASVIIIKE